MVGFCFALDEKARKEWICCIAFWPSFLIANPMFPASQSHSRSSRKQAVRHAHAWSRVESS